MERVWKFVTALADFSATSMDRISDGLLGPWWYLGQFVLQFGVLVMAFSVFRWVIEPIVLLMTFIFNSSAPSRQRVLHVLHWLALPGPIVVVKVLKFPSASWLALLAGLVGISYLRLVQDAPVHPLELRFWTYWASPTDAQAHLRLAMELEKQQRENRAKRDWGTPPASLPNRLENLDRILLAEGIEHRKSTSEITENNEYYEVKFEGEFPSEAFMDFYYRSGWPISIFLLREFESNYRFCAPVRWHRNKITGKIECTNGYNVRVPGDIMGNREDLVIGSVSVLEPWAMKPALALVMEAVGHLKFYSTRYMKQKALHSHRKYRESVAIHCEYTLFPPEFERSSLRKLDVDAREWRDMMVQSVTTRGEESSFVEKDRELISILTITVDRYLVAVFHIAHMMRNANGETVGELTRLFEFLMNPLKPKIWLDLPRGIAALDATMEHIYRGYPDEGSNAPRRPPYRESIDSPVRFPSFKDVGPERYFLVDRPPQLIFPRGAKPCPLGFHGDGVDFAQRSCPCFSGNLDFRDILDTILRTHYFITYPNFARIAQPPEEGKKASTGLDVPAHSSWAEPRVECSYEDFVTWMLAGDKFQPLLHQLRTRGKKAPKPPEAGRLLAAQTRKAYEAHLAAHQRERAKFLRFLESTKDFERNDEQLSYVVGTGIGIAMAFRHLLTCEIPRVTAERLSHYGYREKLDIEPYAFETALFRPLPKECYTYSKDALGAFTLDLGFGGPFNKLNPETGTVALRNLVPDPKLMLSPTHSLIQHTIGQEIDLKYESTGMQYPGWIRPAPGFAMRLPPKTLEPNTNGEETWEKRPIGNGNYGQNIAARNIAVDVFRKIHAPEEGSDDQGRIGSDNTDGRTVTNLVAFMRLVFLLCLHSAKDRPLALTFRTMAYTIGKTKRFRALEANQRIAMQAMWESKQSKVKQAHGPTALLQQKTCAELLILMLILEVSKFENIDTCRREAYKFDIMRHNYAAYTTRSLYDEPEVRALNKESGLDGEFEYEEPYWYKRVQVLVGPMLARGVSLGDTAETLIAHQCGFEGLYELLYKLADEVERMVRLANFHSELSVVLKRICEAAQVPTDRIDNPSPGGFFTNAGRTLLTAVSWGTRGEIDDEVAHTRATLGLSWMAPEWCTFLLNNHSSRPQVIQPRLHHPYSTRKHDQLKAVGALMRRNPTLEPEGWTCFSKWWTRKLRLQALGLADEQVERFHLPDLRIIWPPKVKGEHLLPPEFGLHIRSLDRQRREIARLGMHSERGAGIPSDSEESEAPEEPKPGSPPVVSSRESGWPWTPSPPVALPAASDLGRQSAPVTPSPLRPLESVPTSLPSAGEPQMESGQPSIPDTSTAPPNPPELVRQLAQGASLFTPRPPPPLELLNPGSPLNRLTTPPGDPSESQSPAESRPGSPEFGQPAALTFLGSLPMGLQQTGSPQRESRRPSTPDGSLPPSSPPELTQQSAEDSSPFTPLKLSRPSSPLIQPTSPSGDPSEPLVRAESRPSSSESDQPAALPFLGLLPMGLPQTGSLKRRFGWPLTPDVSVVVPDPPEPVQQSAEDPFPFMPSPPPSFELSGPSSPLGRPTTPSADPSEPLISAESRPGSPELGQPAALTFLGSLPMGLRQTGSPQRESRWPSTPDVSLPLSSPPELTQQSAEDPSPFTPLKLSRPSSPLIQPTSPSGDPSEPLVRAESRPSSSESDQPAALPFLGLPMGLPQTGSLKRKFGWPPTPDVSVVLPDPSEFVQQSAQDPFPFTPSSPPSFELSGPSSPLGRSTTPSADPSEPLISVESRPGSSELDQPAALTFLGSLPMGLRQTGSPQRESGRPSTPNVSVALPDPPELVQQSAEDPFPFTPSPPPPFELSGPSSPLDRPTTPSADPSEPLISAESRPGSPELDQPAALTFLGSLPMGSRQTSPPQREFGQPSTPNVSIALPSPPELIQQSLPVAPSSPPPPSPQT